MPTPSGRARPLAVWKLVPMLVPHGSKPCCGRDMSTVGAGCSGISMLTSRGTWFRSGRAGGWWAGAGFGEPVLGAAVACWWPGEVAADVVVLGREAVSKGASRLGHAVAAGVPEGVVVVAVQMPGSGSGCRGPAVVTMGWHAGGPAGLAAWAALLFFESNTSRSGTVSSAAAAAPGMAAALGLCTAAACSVAAAAACSAVLAGWSIVSFPCSLPGPVSALPAPVSALPAPGSGPPPALHNSSTAGPAAEEDPATTASWLSAPCPSSPEDAWRGCWHSRSVTAAPCTPAAPPLC